MLENNNPFGDPRKKIRRSRTLAGSAHHKGVFRLFGSCASPLLVSATLLIAGCGWFSNTRDDSDGNTELRETGRAVFSDPETRGPNAGVTADPWTIILATLPEGQEHRAPQVLSQVQTQTGLSDAYTQLRSGRVVIAYGSYDGAADPEAVEDLRRIKAVELNGSKPYATAYLAPPNAQALAGSNPEFDLRTVKERFGRGAVYTLQIGVYGDITGKQLSAEQRRENRDAAEQAVRELRAQGERAFYYHGPSMSMVTIGVFSEADFDPSTLPPLESPRLRDLRERFPHNLLNGQGIRQTQMTDTGQRVTRLQPSTLVGIPES